MTILHQLLLLLIDGIFSLRHIRRRVILANLVGFALFTLVLVGLCAVVQINLVLRGLNNLTSDISTGLSATREMRTALFDFRRQVLYAAIRGESIDAAALEAFQRSAVQQMNLYRASTFDWQDTSLAERLQVAQARLDEELAALSASSADRDALLSVDRAAEPLSRVLFEFGRFHAERLQNLAIQLESQIRLGSIITTVLLSALVGFGMLTVVVLLLNFWLEQIERAKSGA